MIGTEIVQIMKKPATIVIAGLTATADCYEQSSIANLAMNVPSTRLI
jgi:hypothetical protein